MSIALREYQETGLAAVERAVSQGCRTPLLGWATGLGKTVLFAHWIGRRGGRALIVAHRDELLSQARDKIGMVLGDEAAANCGIVKADRDECAAPIVLGSVQTLANPERIARCLAAGDFASVVIDEAHHSEAPTYRELTKCLLASSDAPILGVTATPARADQKPLGRTWASLVHHVSILDGIRMGYLCNLRAERVRVDANFHDLRTAHGEIVEGEAERMLLDADAPKAIAEAVQRCAGDRATLIFTAGVELARRTAGDLQRLGIPARSVDGHTPTDDRRNLLRAFHVGELRAVANCAVLTEGYDEPRVSAIVMARPTKSQPFYAQCIGRGTRNYPGKTDCLILDVVGVTARHDLVTLPALFAEDMGHVAREELARGFSIAEALAKEEAEGALHVQPVDPFAVHHFAWVRTRTGFVLGLGSREDGWLSLEEVAQGWAVLQVKPTTTDTLWVGASLEYAQGIAEDRVRRTGTEVLAMRNAPWRKAGISIAQKAALARFGIGWSNEMTKGEAADLLTAAIAGKRRRA